LEEDLQKKGNQLSDLIAITGDLEEELKKKEKQLNESVFKNGDLEEELKKLSEYIVVFDGASEVIKSDNSTGNFN
jgi:hypothetical protein